MGQPTRTHNRYSSLTGYRIVKGDSGDTFERIAVDREGLPVMPLTLYRYLRGAPGPDHMGDTYLDMLCSVFGYFDERGWAWDAPPAPSARMLVAYIGRAYADSIAMTSQNARLARKMGGMYR